MPLREFAIFGVFVGSLSGVALASNCGISQALFTILGQRSPDGGAAANILRTGAFLTAAAGVLLSTAAAYAVFRGFGNLSEASGSIIVGAIVLGWLYALQYYLGEALRATGRIATPALFGNIGTYGGPVQTIVLGATVGLLIVAPFSPNVLLTVIVAQVFSTFSCIVVLSREMLVIYTGLERGVAWPSGIAGLSGFNFLSNLVVYARGQMMLWVGAIFLSAREVAEFVAASRIAALFAILYLILSYSITFYLAKAEGPERERAERAVRSLVTLFSACAIPVFLIMAIWPSEIITVALGAQFRDSAAAMVILCGLNMLHLFMGGTAQTLQLNGRHREFFVYTVSTTIFGGIIAWPLGADRGAAGLAAASLILVLIHYWLIWRDIRRHDIFRSWTYISPRELLACFGRWRAELRGILRRKAKEVGQ